MTRLQAVSQRGLGRFAAIVALALSALPVLIAHPASAQSLPDTFREVDSAPDFFFDQPRVSIGIRGGAFLHRAGSDLYDFTTVDLDNERSDFRSLSFGIEASFWLTGQDELTVNLDGSRVTLPSEYRDFVEDDGTPGGRSIRQTTRLTEGPALSIGYRRYLFPRGESVGEFVWIPRRWNLFAGGGFGLTGYRLEMDGDFIESDTDLITTEAFQSVGQAGLAFLAGGAEITVAPRIAVTLEGRYTFAESELEDDFTGFEPLDLTGARVTAGLHYRL